MRLVEGWVLGKFEGMLAWTNVGMDETYLYVSHVRSPV